MAQSTFEKRVHLRRVPGAWRQLSTNVDDIAAPLVVDGIAWDGLPLEAGEAMIVNRSTANGVRMTATFTAAGPVLGLAGAGGILSGVSLHQLPIGINGSLWLACATAGATSAITVWVR